MEARMMEDGIIVVVTIDPTLAGVGAALRECEVTNDHDFDELLEVLNLLPYCAVCRSTS
jgi:hypothetical protein